MSKRLLPTTAAGVPSVLLWVISALAEEEPNHELLVRGLPQGRLRKAQVAIDADYMNPWTEVSIRDEHKKRTKEVRTPRLMDPPAFAVVRALQLPKVDIRLARNVLRTDPERHYPSMFDDLTVARIIAGAKKGEGATPRNNHYDLRRANLRLIRWPMSKYAARERAMSIALENFCKLDERAWLRRALRSDDYEWLLKTLFALLDRLPLGDEKTGMEAAE